MIFPRPLTPRQREIFDFLRVHISEKGYAPSLEEIGERFRLRSLATVHKHLQNLVQRGYIERRWNHARSIEIRVRDGCCPTCGQTMPSGHRDGLLDGAISA